MQRPTPADSTASPGWEEIKASAVPVLLLDPARRRIVDANAAGLAQWWGQSAARPLPLVLDAATTGLATLREGNGPDAQQAQDSGFGELVLWAPSGLLTAHVISARTAQGLVAVTLAPRVAAASEGGAQATVRTPGRGAKLAHELRTPLAAIAAYAEVVAQEHFGPLGDDRYRDYARIIQDSARHALGVVEGMLASAAQATARGPRELRFTDVDPARIAESCLTVIAPAAHQAGLSLELDCPPGLPRIIADEVSVRQMLLNLLTNAVKFARQGDRVRLAVTQAADGALTFAVEDTGPGLAASRETETPRVALGLGVGLPLTRELAEANGAALDIESEPGCGTRARISFSPARVVPAW